MIRAVLPLLLLLAASLPLDAQALSETLTVGTFNLQNPGDHARDNAHLFVIQPSQNPNPVSIQLTLDSVTPGFLLPFLSFATGIEGYGTQNFVTVDGNLNFDPPTLPFLVSLSPDQHLFIPNLVATDAALQALANATLGLALANPMGNPLALPPLDLATVLNLPPSVTDADTLYIQGARLDLNAPLSAVDVTFSDGITLARVEPVGVDVSAPAGEVSNFGYFGEAMVTARLNNDAFDDLIVGAPGHGTPSTPSAGRVLIYLGTANGLSDVPFILEEPSMLQVVFPSGFPVGFSAGPEAFAEFGAAVAVGDLDHDQMTDIVVGAPGASSVNATAGTEPSTGEVYVIRGSALAGQLGAPPAVPTPITLDQSSSTTDFFSLIGTAASAFRPLSRTGATLAVGDANGDGIDDLAVAAPTDDDDSTPSVLADSGRVYLYEGPFTASVQNFIDARALLEPQVAAASLYFGESLLFADLDGFGGDELLVGAPGQEVAGAARAGQVTSWDVATTPMVLEFFSAGTPTAGAGLGQSIAAGDLDDDGVVEVVAGSNEEVAGVLETGAVHFWADGSLAAPQRILPFGSPDVRRFGFALLAADLNDDGITDLAVGAPGTFQGAQVSQGAAMVYFGNQQAATALDDPLRRLFLEGPNSNALDAFGAAFAAGDFNGPAVGVPALRSLLVAEPLGEETGRLVLFEDLLARTPADGLPTP